MTYVSTDQFCNCEQLGQLPMESCVCLLGLCKQGEAIAASVHAKYAQMSSYIVAAESVSGKIPDQCTIDGTWRQYRSGRCTVQMRERSYTPLGIPRQRAH